MGNDHSQLPGIEIEEKAVEVSDFWSQHSANIFSGENATELSVFVGELFVNGPLWTTHTPLEKSSKNLMIYRHPCILKYISSWQKNSKFFLAVEPSTPLSHVLPSLKPLQICIGLHSILKALCFLHEKAFVSHNNICTASIYITRDGSWKLGGMEYLCRYKDLSRDYLNKAKTNRYSKAIDSNEDKNVENIAGRKDFIDLFAFGIMVCEVLRSRNDEDISTLSSFRELCRTDLQSVNISERPKFSTLLDHDFFKHEFIVIHSFLVELPLKSDEEKTDFFTTLGVKLKTFSEETVANQLASLLLSRMVLLNKTAQSCLLPAVLCPRKDQNDNSGLFSKETFIKYFSPKILQIFSVRDAQIRLLLLDYFPYYLHTFTVDELETQILPELLLGIKDTNDHLVAVTLRALADLVPILGATTVIGGKRAKLFNDGRPIIHSVRKSSKVLKRDILQTQAVQTNDQISIDTSLLDIVDHHNRLPERPSPDGEEGETTSTGELEQSVDEDLDNWEDWENAEALNFTNGTLQGNELSSIVVEENLIQIENNVNLTRNKVMIEDITKLDIKNQLSVDESRDEFDFFQDMEPVIKTSNKFLITKDDNTEFVESLSKDVNHKLNLDVADENNEDGWVDEEWE